jgi:hypothetical protein
MLWLRGFYFGRVQGVSKLTGTGMRWDLKEYNKLNF